MSEQIIELTEPELRFIGRIAYEGDLAFKRTKALRGTPYHELEEHEFSLLEGDVRSVAQGGASTYGEVFDEIVRAGVRARGDYILTAAARSVFERMPDANEDELVEGLVKDGALAGESKPKGKKK